MASRTVLRVDNHHSEATVDAITGAGITVNPDCGVVRDDRGGGQHRWVGDIGSTPSRSHACPP